MHGLVLVTSAVGLFFAWIGLGELQPGPTLIFPESASMALYASAVFVSACWMQDVTVHFRTRLGCLDWFSALRLSRHQLLRVALMLLCVQFFAGTTGGRYFLVGYIGLLGVWLVLANMYVPRIIARWFFGGSTLRTLCIAPAGSAPSLCRWVNLHRHLGAQLIGYCGDDESAPTNGTPCLGPLDNLSTILREHRVAQVVICASLMETAEGKHFVTLAEEAGCRVRAILQFGRVFRGNSVSVEQTGECVSITLAAEPLDNPVNRFTKRALDIAISVPVVMFVLPVLSAVVWFMQRRESPGPLFYRQLRTGRDQRPFMILKYRTMHVREDRSDEAVQATTGDTRVFKFGRFLRRSSLDEIPQFLNVLIGEMSVSGPRPHLMQHDEDFASLAGPSYRRRHFVKPGITGLAQSKGFRGEIFSNALLQRRLHYDKVYVMQWSLLMDLKIILQTARQILFPPRAAY